MNSLNFGMNVSQQQRQSQQMKMSTQMLQSLSFLTMNNMEFSDYIYEETLKNPALEIIKDRQVESGSVLRLNKTNPENIRIMNSARDDKSDAFQNFLENQTSPDETLQEHLLKQYRLTTSDAVKLNLVQRLISNLDEKGFNKLSPEKLLDGTIPEENIELLNICLSEIQHLEPVGCGTSCSEDSLLVQAKIIKEQKTFNCDEKIVNLAIFILSGHLSVLEKTRPSVVLKKIQTIFSENSTDFYEKTNIAIEDLSERIVQSVVEFIQSLDPFPARQFSQNNVGFIVPDIRVTKVVSDENPNTWQFKVETMKGVVPEVALSKEYTDFYSDIKTYEHDKNLSQTEKEQRKFIKNSIKDAQWFLNAIKYRENTLLKAALGIVHAQKLFFEKGPRYLAPLKMKDIAEIVGVHETTISRFANGKYIQCEWGLFEIKYFFSSQVATKQISTEQVDPENLNINARSKESVKQELKEIILKYSAENPSKKPLSDQKLSDILAQRGIQVARRTVAKYRSELNIESSFERK